MSADLWTHAPAAKHPRPDSTSRPEPQSSREAKPETLSRCEAPVVSEVSGLSTGNAGPSKPPAGRGRCDRLRSSSADASKPPERSGGGYEQRCASGDRAILPPEFLRVNTNDLQTSEANPA